MKIPRRFTALMLAAGLAFGLGCGGGGGGGTSESVSYDGSTDPAVIDTTSAVELARDAVEFVESDPTRGASPLSGSGILSSVRFANPEQAIRFAKGYYDAGRFSGGAQSLSATAEPLAVICQSSLFDTTATGGELWLEICGDPVEMQGTVYYLSIGFDFRDYDDGSELVDGELIVRGTFDESAAGGNGDFVGNVQVVFRDLSTVSSAEDTYLDGWVDYAEAGSVTTMEYNLFVVDNNAPDAAWLDGYTIVLDDAADTVTIDGRLYDYWAGYVEVSTVTPLDWTMHYDALNEELVFDDRYPTGGKLRLTGAGGAWIEIEFRDNAGTPELRVTVDVDNEPTDSPLWEWQSAWLPWS